MTVNIRNILRWNSFINEFCPAETTIVFFFSTCHMSNGHYLSERLMKSGIHVSITISVAFRTATCDNAQDNDGPALSQLAYGYSAYCAMGDHCIYRESVYWRALLLYSRNMYVWYHRNVGNVLGFKWLRRILPLHSLILKPAFPRMEIELAFSFSPAVVLIQASFRFWGELLWV